MNKKIIKISLMFILFIFALAIKSTVQANSITSIDMDIYIDKNGNAQVTEKWNCTTNQGTEVYHPYYNLGNSKITNLQVSDQTKTYTTLSSWDISGSMTEKAYQCGINIISNGVELCWGISKYGSNVYTVRYNISNFVSELTDAQMAYWTLIPYDFTSPIGSMKIKIHADKAFPDTIDVWGYGNYGGLCYVNNGAIYMQSDGSLATSEYMTILAKFPKETFNTSNLLKHDFNYYYEMAEEGSTKYNKKKAGLKDIIMNIFAFLVEFFPFIIMVVIGIFGKAITGKKYGFKYGSLGKSTKDAAYYRDIPCEGDLFKAYYIAYNYDLVKNYTDILGAIILKWLKQGVIKTENREGGKIFKREDTVILLGDNKEIDLGNTKENELFSMMYKASKDGILENKEFEVWCRDSYKKVTKWFDDILKEERNKLVIEGLIIDKNNKVPVTRSGRYEATPELKAEAMKLAGLKKFLLEYTLIEERKDIEVEIFEDYLIYAQMLGIAKQVSKQFKELYPDLIEQTNYNSYDNLIYINYVSSRGVNSANAARAAAESYSSGGGGFSSGGGGGGSFGGGGGRRRIPLIKKETEMDRSKKIIKVSILGIVVNLILVAFKAIIGIIVNSIAIILDAVNNLSDALSSIITIIGTKLSEKRPDKKHPYGYGRIEYFSSVIIAVIVLLAGITSLKESVEKILHPEAADYSVISLVIIVVAVFVKFFFGRYVKRQGEKLNSGSLVASGTDAISDSVLSLSTFVAAIISIIWKISLEGYLGVIISIIILKSAIEILKDTINDILGVRADSETTKKLKEKISSYKEVIGVYDVTLHNYGPSKILATAHIQVDDDMTAKEIHRVSRRITIEVYQELGIILTIGIYASNDKGEYGEIQKEIKQIISKYKNIIQIHGFYVDEEINNISFDLIFNFDELEPEKIVTEISQKLKEKHPKYDFNIIIDTVFSD